MFNRRRQSLAITIAAFLLVASAASADPLKTSMAEAPMAEAPTTTITVKPSNPSNVSSPSFEFTADAAATFECKLDDEAFAQCTSPKSYVNRTDGPHTFSVRATHGANETGPEATYTWTIDTAPPTVTITATPPNPSNATSPSFVFTTGDATSVQCKLDSVEFASCSSPMSYTGLAAGPHNFDVAATDAAGNVGTAGYSWTIDTTPPIASITDPPDDPSKEESPLIKFTANEPADFECRLDGPAFTPCTSPWQYFDLADGAHTFAVRAKDAAGNTGPEEDYLWTIDTTGPTTEISGMPSGFTNKSSATFTFGASEPNSSFACRRDQEISFTSCSPPTHYTNLTAGSHIFLVRATDALGNTGPETSYSWVIDFTAPITTITGKPSDPSNIESPTFAFTASEASTFQCRLDGAAFTSCSSPWSYQPADDGSHTFDVRATDLAGNIGAIVSHTWVIDTLAPAATITLKPGNPSSTNSPTFAFTASESSSFTCRLDGGGFAPCTSPTSYSNLADGPHTFAARATDTAGNTGPEASHAWTIETRAPTAVLTSTPPGVSNNSTASFAFSADEPSSFECTLDERGFEPCSSPATFHALGDGRHAFSVRARDAVGNFSAAVSHAWAIDTTAPETTLASAPKSATTATSATFVFSASENGTFECTLDGAPFALCASPRSYEGLGQGDHRFEVRAIDAAGNADATPSRHGWKIEAAVRTISSSALLAPRSGARVTKPPLLVWRSVASARYYNVQVFRGKQKILSAWPTRARLRLHARWKFLGRAQRLTPGSYRWYVWPGYGAPSARRYGQLLGQSTFVVARSVRR